MEEVCLPHASREFPPHVSICWWLASGLYHCLHVYHVSHGVRHLPRWHTPRPQSLSSRHSSLVRSAEAGTHASYGEFSSWNNNDDTDNTRRGGEIINMRTLYPSGHLHVGKWFTETQTAPVPHSENPRQGSLHWPSRHSWNTWSSSNWFFLTFWISEVENNFRCGCNFPRALTHRTRWCLGRDTETESPACVARVCRQPAKVGARAH